MGRKRSPRQVLWFRVKYNARRKLLRSAPGGSRELFEVGEIALPGRVHHAAEAFRVVLPGVEPVADAFGRGVVVAGKDLRMASLGEVLQAERRFAAVPVDNDRVLSTMTRRWSRRSREVLLGKLILTGNYLQIRCRNYRIIQPGAEKCGRT